MGGRSLWDQTAVKTKKTSDREKRATRNQYLFWANLAHLGQPPDQ